MIYAIKKSNESNERLINRFKKIMQRSRVVVNAKGSRFHSRPESKAFLRQAAIMRATHRKRRELEHFSS